MSPQNDKGYFEDPQQPIPLWRVKEFVTEGKREMHAYLDGRLTEMTKYVDARDKHKEANSLQEVEDLRAETERRHGENQDALKEIKARQEKASEKYDIHTKYIYIGIGIMIALQAVGFLKH